MNRVLTTEQKKRKRARERERREFPGVRERQRQSVARYRSSLSREEMAAQQRKGILKRKYGLTPEQFEQMKNAQNFACAICFHREKLGIDHCHKTGKVRALLCSKCNTAIGLLQESLTVLESAKNYLLKHQTL